MLINNVKIQQSYKKLLKYNQLSTSHKETIDYKHNEKDRDALKKAIKSLYKKDNFVPCVIDGEEIYSGDEQLQKTPHNHKRTLVKFYYGTQYHIRLAIKKAVRAQVTWGTVAVSEKVKIWRKCADIIDQEDRHLLTAAIILGQSKTYVEADKDTTRILETLRSTATYLEELSKFKLKSSSPDNIFPIQRLRPLDGFVAAVGPFNMTSISCNLAFTPAIMGNSVLWKPSNNCIYASYIAFKAMQKAGLPKGVINFVPANGNLFLDTVAKSSYLSGVNFTGSLETLRTIWHTVGFNICTYRSFPRIVGECGGKNYHFVHESADLNLVIKATTDAAFEYSGQKCTSCSRLYVPASVWPQISCGLQEAISSIKIGDSCDFFSYSSAVINEAAFNKIVSYLLYAEKNEPSVEVICGGDFNKTVGYFIEPTVLLCKNPFDRLMNEEILGPILSVYVYDNDCLDEILTIIAKTSKYALTGSIFANDDEIICKVLKALRMASGNIYINNKCTGSKLSLKIYAGNRLSGTNDNLEPQHHLLRWTSPQLVEELILRDSECYEDYN